jgi:chemosensory pili system protein ChpA (sensor histidine kinase/response regulator)
MTDNYDQLALSWVRKEINHTLNQAKKGLESFVDDSQDETQIQFCINSLHQVQGTLQMLGFEGAANLATEMEAVAENIANSTPSSFNPNATVLRSTENAYEVLMRALIQMPGYLERIEGGQKDVPVILLPLINELRLVINKAPVAESDVFSAETETVEPPKPVQAATKVDKTSRFQEHAKKLRVHFQRGLADILRGQKVKEGLARVHNILVRLEALTEGESVARLWWIADGFIFAIAEKGLYKKKQSHFLLSQIDKQIKQLAERGESALSDVIPKKLLSKLLYFIAHSNSKNARVLNLKKEFKLDAALPKQETITHQREQLSLPDSTAMIDVISAITEELESVKDQLDLFVRSKAKDISQVKSLVGSLTTIRDTLTLLELPIPRDVIEQQLNTVKTFLDKNKLPNDGAIMDLAGALLFVDANLINLDTSKYQSSTDGESNTEIGESRAKETQVNDATEALVKVARKNLQVAKDSMVNYIASTFKASELDDVPRVLDEVLGAMRIVHFDDAADILITAKRFVSEKLLCKDVAPIEKHLDALADIVTSVDYYLEGTEEGNVDAVKAILRNALSSQELLNKVLEFVEHEASAGLSSDNQELEKQDSQSKDHQDSDSSQVELNHTDAPSLAEEQQQERTAEVIPLLHASAEKEIDESLIDDEVLEIFLEEVEEEIASIETNLPKWINDINDVTVRADLRRSFHTLKGSGRLVGAKDIGELSWAVENMLNKVIEDSLVADQTVTNLLNQTLSLLPKLIKSFSEKETNKNLDIDVIIDKANHLANGLDIASFVEYQPVPVEDEIPTLLDKVGSDSKDDSIDPVLLEIFVNEAKVHLAAINQFLSNASIGSKLSVTDALIRALHTLKGSAHMATVSLIAQIVGPLEQYARLIKGNSEYFEDEAVGVYTSACNAVTEIIENLQKSESIESKEYENILVEVTTLANSQPYSSSAGASNKQRDQNFVSIFLTEGLDILNEVTSLLEKFVKNPHELVSLGQISSELHTFRRGSEMISVDSIHKIAIATEAVSRVLVDTGDDKKEYCRLTNLGVDSLTGMLNQLASQEDINTPTALVDEMHRWVAEFSRINAPADMNQELVELFVEEADELTESALSLLTKFKYNYAAEPVLKEIRRVFHTLKGSSRMAGAMNIGDLSFAVEEIYNGAVDGRKVLGNNDYILSVKANDQLIEMVDVLRSFRWPDPAISQINAIRLHLGQEPIPNDKKDIIQNVSSVLNENSIGSATLEATDINATDINATDINVIDIGVADVDVDANTIDSTFEQIVIDEFEPIQIEEIVEETESEIVAELIETEEKVENLKTDYFIKPQEKKERIISEDTIAPASPLIMSGNVQKLELDEDGLEVLEIYLEEAEELLIALDEGLHLWSEKLSNRDAIDTLQRILHTFKGGARLSDLMILGDLTHEMETYFEKINAGSLDAELSDVNFLLRGYDTIATLIEEVKSKNQMTVPEKYLSELKQLISGVDPAKFVEASQTSDFATKTEDTIDETTSNKKEVVPNEKTISGTKQKVDKASGKSEAKEKIRDKADIVSFEEQKKLRVLKQKAVTADVVRINSTQLEDLTNLAGETSIFRSRVEQQMSVLRNNLVEMSSTVDRLNDQLRNLDIETEAQISYRREITGGTEYDDFDPLEMDRYTRQQELTRSLGESAGDLMNLKDTLDSLISDSETLLLQQGRVNTEMQESLMQTRMTPFESLVPRLRRMIRQISTELGKTVSLSISADGEMDRNVLERMIAPLEHMLRNAMDHGIESPEERKKLNKPVSGKIAISLYREGSEVFIKIKDDGSGLNLDAIKNKALERGLITEFSELSDKELRQLILEAGFSTAEKVTQISGRGVGMDVVSSEIKQLGGIIEIESQEGFGSTFTVRLPFTVSVNHALMVLIGEEIYAIPLANIEGIVRVSPYELDEYYNDREAKFAYAGIDYSMYYLGQMLDRNVSHQITNHTQPLPVLLLHGADHPTALQVDELLGNREIVVKSVGKQLSSVSGISGATIQGDGRVVLILDMPALVRRVDATITEEPLIVEDYVEEVTPRIMVVDDSITVRKVTTRLLERHDYDVMTAKDGVDAVTVLNDDIPDVMLLDIEMPRMDGFELATIIRHDERLKNIPIIMITSRTGEKHRDRAMTIGVNEYMGKPYNETDLIETINKLLSEAKQANNKLNDNQNKIT